MRTISPISTGARRLLSESFGLGFAGRPDILVVAACLIFFAVLGRIFGIAASCSLPALGLFSDNYLKKRYLFAGR
ncbi:MAG TPA: hypothetical protein VGA15_05530 [Bradyrhizobium sp.]